MPRPTLDAPDEEGLPDRSYGDPDFTLEATADSGLSVEFTASGACSVTGPSVSITGAGTCTITASQNGNDNWNPAVSVEQSFAIAKATLTITPDSKSILFGDPDPAFTFAYSGFVSPDGPASMTTPPTCGVSGAHADAGAYLITCSGGVADDYTFSSRSATLIVGQATPVITWATPADITYGTALSATQLDAAAGVPGTFTYNPALGTVLTAGSHTLSVTFAPTDTANYTDATATITLSVRPALLTVTADNTSRPYGSANPVFTASYAGFVDGDTSAVLSGSPSLTTTATAASAVGGYPVTAAQGTLAAANYSFRFADGTLSVRPADLVIRATSASKTYGDTVTFGGTEFTVSGFANGDGIASTDLTSAGAAPRASVAGGPYPIVPSMAVATTWTDLGNYAVSYVDGSLVVEKADASVTPNAASKTYGTTDPALTGTLTGFLAADGVTASYSRTAGETVAGGPYTISATLSPAGVLANYAITSDTANFTITRAVLTVTADAKSRTYGSANPALTATISGFVAGDPATVVAGSPALSTTATSGSPLGAYPVTAAQGDPLAAANYGFTYLAGTLSVTTASLTISVNAKTRMYGAPNPTLDATYAGFVNDEGPAVLGGTLTCSTTAGSTSPVGTYPITCAGRTSTNYAISYLPGTVTVTKAPLTVMANDITRLLGASAPAFTVSYTGFVNGETAAVLGGTLVVAPTASVSASVPGAYTLRASGRTSSNYAIGYVDGRLTTTYRICLLYDATKPVTGSTIPLKLYLCNAGGTNRTTSTVILTAIEIDRNGSKVVSASGSFTFGAKLTAGGGYQYNVSTKGLTAGRKIAYTLKFRVSTDVPGVYQYSPFILR